MFKMVLQPEAEEWLRGWGLRFLFGHLCPFRLDINPTHPLTSALVKGNYRLRLQLAVTPRWTHCFLAFFWSNPVGGSKLSTLASEYLHIPLSIQAAFQKLVNRHWVYNSQIRSNQWHGFANYIKTSFSKFCECILNRPRKGTEKWYWKHFIMSSFVVNFIAVLREHTVNI